MTEFTPQVFTREEAMKLTIDQLEGKARYLLADLSYISDLMWKCSEDYQLHREATADFKRWEMMTSKRHPSAEAMSQMKAMQSIMQQTRDGYLMHKRLSVVERTINQMVSLIQSILRTERELAR